MNDDYVARVFTRLMLWVRFEMVLILLLIKPVVECCSPTILTPSRESVFMMYLGRSTLPLEWLIMMFF